MKLQHIAFEVSDSYEHHAHILPLVYLFSKDPDFKLTLYSIHQKHIDAFNDLHENVYAKGCDLSVNLIGAGITHRLKHNLVKLLKPLKLAKLTKALRSMYGGIRGKSMAVEGGNDFYLKNLEFFKKQTAIFTTELKGGSVLREEGVKIIFCLHGIISNDNPFFKDWHCDLVISPSIGLENKLRMRSNFPKDAFVYSYAYLKKEVINKLSTRQTFNLFKRNQFTFLYNPHWDNGLGQSSWEKFGKKILDLFIKNPNYNLIFAPHILIDKYFGITLDEKFHHASNIHIDINSPRLCSGYYIPFTDCYIGDVSSQYFEFLLCNKKIQSIFINASLMNWRELESYDYWHNGDVVDSFDALAREICLNAKGKSIISKDKLYSEIFSDLPENQVELLKEFIINHVL